MSRTLIGVLILVALCVLPPQFAAAQSAAGDEAATRDILQAQLLRTQALGDSHVRAAISPLDCSGDWAGQIVALMSLASEATDTTAEFMAVGPQVVEKLPQLGELFFEIQQASMVFPLVRNFGKEQRKLKSCAEVNEFRSHFAPLDARTRGQSPGVLGRALQLAIGERE